MTNIRLSVLILALSLPALVQAESSDATRQFSEAIGLQAGNQLKAQGIDLEAVIAGLRKAMAGEPSPSGEQMAALQRGHEAARQAVQAGAGAAWKAEAGLPASVHDQFYAEFIKMDGVTVTPSGLAYQVLKAAEGAKPVATSTVKVHYTGRHTTGAIFDSSVERGEPIDFPLNGVIKGWTEGVQLMPVGSTFRFVIPGELAYGKLQEGSQRPTGVLVFDVELLQIVK